MQPVHGCLRKENVFSKKNKTKKVWEISLHFIKKKESRSDLQVAVSKWAKWLKKQNETREKQLLWKVDPKKRV